MHIHRISLQDKMPNNKHIAWAEPLGSEKINLKIYKDKKWVPIGSSSSIDMSKAIKIDSSTNGRTFFNKFLEYKGITQEDVNSMSDEEYNNLEVEFSEWLKQQVFITEDHGIATFIGMDNYPPFTSHFECEDGYGINISRVGFITIPPKFRYVIRPTSKLPTRESDTGSNSNSGSNSGLLTHSGESNTGNYLIVMDHFTGNPVDPVDLHNLTDVIWYSFNDMDHAFILSAYNTGTPSSEDYGDIVMSMWYSHTLNRGCSVQYDFEVKLGPLDAAPLDT